MNTPRETDPDPSGSRQTRIARHAEPDESSSRQGRSRVESWVQRSKGQVESDLKESWWWLLSAVALGAIVIGVVLKAVGVL